MRLALPLILFSVFSMAATSPKMATNADLEKDFELYRNARVSTDLVFACETFQTLAKKKNFPLKTLAALHSSEKCPLGLEVPLEEPLPSWLEGLANDLQVIRWRSHLGEKPEVKIELARALQKKARRSRDVNEKEALLREALETLPKKGPADLVVFKMELQTGLENAAPRLIPRPEPKDYFRVGQSFVAHRDFAKGRSYFRKIWSHPQTPLDKQIQARLAYRQSFRSQQKKDEFLKNAVEFAHWADRKKLAAEIVVEAWITVARAQWTAGLDDAALRSLTHLEKQAPLGLDDIEWIRGRMREEKKDYSQAQVHFEKAEKSLRPNSPLQTKLLFSRGWMLRKQGQFEAAAKAFQEGSSRVTDASDQMRFFFWEAQSLKQAEKSSEAKEKLRQLINQDPLGYYGMLAAYSMGDPLPPFRKSFHAKSFPSAKIESQDLTWMDALAQGDELETLKEFLDQRTSQLALNSEKDFGTWLVFAKAYARAGLYLPLFAQVSKLDPELRETLLVEEPELLFPRKFFDVIDQQSQRFGVPTELTLALIRQESAFNPRARSPVDALGLMQVLPTAADRKPLVLGRKIKNYEELFDPLTNVIVGASLVSHLQKKYAGQEFLVAAAYNAGEIPTDGWLKNRFQKDQVEFIEDIPFDETRTYMKLILRNFVMYARLKDPSKSIPFPLNFSAEIKK